MSDGPIDRGARLVAMGIMLSRVFGLVRNWVFARYFATGYVADAFNAALRIPNVVRNLLGEGTISASFVPVYAAALERGDTRAANALANALLGILLVVVSLLTLAGVAAAPLLTTLFFRDASAEAAELTTRLLRVLFPMTGVMVLSGWCLGVQNAHRRFFLSYASAVMWSVAQIALLWWGGGRTDTVQLAVWLSWATLGGAVLQVAVQAPQALRLLGEFRPTLAVHAAGVGETIRNFAPVVGALGLFQISSLIDLGIAGMLPTGAIASLTYATNVHLLPLSLFGVATAAAALPELARQRSRGDLGGLGEGITQAWQRAIFYVVPSAVAFIGVGDLIVRLLYRSGAFGADDERLVHLVLAAYAVGLMAYASARVLTAAFHALQDYRSPFRAAAVTVVVSAAGALSLAYPFRDRVDAAAGIALGSSLGAFVNVALLWRGIRAQVPGIAPAATRRVAGASLLAAGVALLVARGAQLALADAPPLAAPLVALPAYGAVFLIVARQLRLAEAERLWRAIVRRRLAQ